MTKTAVYVRQSVSNLNGIDRQRIRCVALAEARGWDVVETFEDDDVSATKPRGAGTKWALLLKGAQAGRYTHVIAVDVDRLLRTTRDLVTLMDSGLKVVTLDGELDTSTADGEFRATIAAGLARFETQRKHERTMRAEEHRAAQGLPRSGKRPYGWESDRLTLRESEATWVRQMTAWVIEGVSLYAIAQRLNASGVQAFGGGKWQPTMVRKCVDRPRNAGLLERLGEIQPVSQIQAAVSREDWDLACSLLKQNVGTQPVGAKAEGTNWLSGVLTCVCGHGMNTKHVWGRGAAGTRVQTRTYICADPHRTGRGHTTINAQAAEEWVTDYMFGWLLGGPVAEVDASEMRSIQEALTQVAAERSAATDALLVPGIDTSRVRARLSELEARREALEVRRAAVAAEDTSLRSVLEVIPHFDRASDTDRNAFRAAWEGVDPAKRKALIKSQLVCQVNPGGQGAKRISILPR